MFNLSKYTAPDFSQAFLKNAPNATTMPVTKDGIAPDNYHATTIFPEYFKINGEWLLAGESRMDCVAVVDGREIHVVEFRNLRLGDQVVIGRSEDASEGIYVYTNGFTNGQNPSNDLFSFRRNRSRETAFSRDYDELYELLRYERDHGYILWVMGPACAFDSDARSAFAGLVREGFVDAVLAGNALATHDLEGAYLRTALGQDIYTQKSQPMGHYNHLDTLNRIRSCGSIPAFIEQEQISDGIIYSCMKSGVPFVLAGSIRDDGPIPEVFGNVYEAQNAMREHARKATTVICLATALHTIAVGNMTPSYHVAKDGKVRQVYFYCVDISEFAVNKLGDRGSLAAKSIVTNVQDFIVNVYKGVQKAQN